jgi:hypothetical protein
MPADSIGSTVKGSIMTNGRRLLWALIGSLAFAVAGMYLLLDIFKIKMTLGWKIYAFIGLIVLGLCFRALIKVNWLAQKHIVETLFEPPADQSGFDPDELANEPETKNFIQQIDPSLIEKYLGDARVRSLAHKYICAPSEAKENYIQEFKDYDRNQESSDANSNK